MAELACLMQREWAFGRDRGGVGQAGVREVDKCAAEKESCNAKLCKPIMVLQLLEVLLHKLIMLHQVELGFVIGLKVVNACC